MVSNLLDQYHSSEMISLLIMYIVIDLVLLIYYRAYVTILSTYYTSYKLYNFKVNNKLFIMYRAVYTANCMGLFI